MLDRTRELIRAGKFLIISISAGIIQLGSFALFYEVFKWAYWLAYLVSLLLSVIWNFTINRKVTFKSASNVKVAMLLVLAFYAVFTPTTLLLGSYIEGLGVKPDIEIKQKNQNEDNQLKKAFEILK